MVDRSKIRSTTREQVKDTMSVRGTPVFEAHQVRLVTDLDTEIEVPESLINDLFILAESSYRVFGQTVISTLNGFSGRK